MLRKLKQLFHVTLFLGVIASFILRCSSQPTEATVEFEEDEPVKVSEKTPSEGRLHIKGTQEDPAKGLRPELSVEDFRANNARLLRDLPTTEEIRKNPHKEDYHETPKAIVAAGKSLGAVLERMKSNPQYVEAGIDFYRSCADNRDIVLQIKALCLRNFRDWNEKIGRREGKRFATDVEKLARRIPKTQF